MRERRLVGDVAPRELGDELAEPFGTERGAVALGALDDHVALLREECPQLRGRELSAAVPNLHDSRYTSEERELSDEPALGEEHIGAVEEGRDRRARGAAAERRFESGRGPPQHECAQLRAADAANTAAARTAKRSRHRICREEKARGEI